MNSIDECELDPILDRPEIRIPIIAAYIAVFLICLIGNLFTILVICAHRAMRTATNFFLANLAIADLLVAIFCICQNMFHLVGTNNGRWIFGATMCKMYAFVLHLVPCTGIGILVCVSVEKYIAVLHPLLALKVLTPRFRVLLMAAIWVISVMFNLPYYTSSKYVPYTNDVSVCTRHYYNSSSTSSNSNNSNSTSDFFLISLMNTRNMVTLSFVLWYCVPLVTIAFLYTRVGLVLWQSAPLKKLTQAGALRTNSNETTTILSAIGGYTKRAKRSVTHPPPAPPAPPPPLLLNACGTELAGERRPSAGPKRSNGANSLTAGSEFALPHILMTPRLRSETMSSDGGQDGSGGEGEETPLGDEGGSRDKDDDGQAAGSALQWADGRRSGQGPTKTKNNEKDGTAMLGIPNGTVLVGTVESRKKVIRLLIAIVSSFAILTLPHHIRLVYTVWTEEQMCLSSLEPLVQPITYLLLFLSSSCNPFLYAFMSQRFRSAIGDIFKCRRGRERRKSVRTQNSDVVGCTTTFGGGGGSTRGGGMGASTDEGVPLFSSLSRLNCVTGPALPQNQPPTPAALSGGTGSERNLLLTQPPIGSRQLLRAQKKEKKNFGIASAASSVVCSAQRSNGSVQNMTMTVVYRKGNRP